MISEMFLSEENIAFLEHHGIKGMRWGVRRKRKGGSSKKPLRRRLGIKDSANFTTKDKEKRAMKIIAALMITDFAQAKIRSYTHPRVRAHNKKVVKNKAKERAYNFTKKVMERQQEKKRRESTIKLMANAESGVKEAIQYIDTTWNK